MQIRPIDPMIAVAPQVQVGDLVQVAALGYRAIVNNRPDDEEPGQPDAAAIRAAAEAAGLRYHAIPVTHAGFSLPQVEAMIAVRAEANGPVLAFCRSGTRSCYLWGLAAAREGTPVAEIIDLAAAAGYDLSPIQPLLDQLARG